MARKKRKKVETNVVIIIVIIFILTLVFVKYIEKIGIERKEKCEQTLKEINITNMECKQTQYIQNKKLCTCRTTTELEKIILKGEYIQFEIKGEDTK